ncbi:hypothetical protein CPB85DRAFT_1313762 [Mucidula mucida]|nr:hypothetical protein CPB85DRAFT_1313762 [Mucidula mucida]
MVLPLDDVEDSQRCTVNNAKPSFGSQLMYWPTGTAPPTSPQRITLCKRALASSLRNWACSDHENYPIIYPSLLSLSSRLAPHRSADCRWGERYRVWVSSVCFDHDGYHTCATTFIRLHLVLYLVSLLFFYIPIDVPPGILKYARYLEKEPSHNSTRLASHVLETL